MVLERCQFSTSNDEDETIDLEILDANSTILIEGFYGEVNDRFEWDE